ncbi:MAG: lamin tail domain-containing protein [Verrucomicrobiales bacterium]|nr:lamin tail domain-containing protein [Verrucomicrobiales bacterium]
MKHSRTLIRLLLTFILAGFHANAEPATNAIYQASIDLLADESLPGAENGSNGVWTYGGYNPSLTQFTPFTADQHLDNWPASLQSGTFQGYASLAGDATPTLVVNTNRTTAQSPCCGITPIAPGKILMHPSSPAGGNFGDTYDVPTLRWTAPGDGTVSVTGNFLQRHGLTQRGYILTNGIVARTGVSSRNAGTSLSVTGLVVRLGDTIDVGVGPGPSGYGSGSTETDATIAFVTAITAQPIIIVSEPADQAVEENQPAVFRVQIDNNLAFYQWQREGVDIPGATDSTYTVTNALVTQNPTRFRCVITNAVSTNITRQALLSVSRDTTAPTLLSVQNNGAQNLVIQFSEAVDITSSTASSNYTLDRGVTVLSAAFGADDRTILLQTSPLVLDQPATLTVSRVRDRASIPNVIRENTSLSFTPRGYQREAIGNPAPVGSSTAQLDGYDVTAGGSDIGGRSDQLELSYEVRQGDFDVEVRVESLSLSDAWAKAGLMARASLSAGSPFAAILATPSISGTVFESRTTTGGVASVTGSFPVNFPSTWLRLQRAGNRFSGFASLDGENWMQLGSATLSFGDTTYFGMAVTSHNTNQTTLAKFRNLGPGTGRLADAIPLPSEPLGPSSRRTGLVFSEIMYRPAPGPDGKGEEYVELFNTLPYFEDLSGYSLGGEIDYRFPNGTLIPAGGVLVIAQQPSELARKSGITGILGPYAGSLPDNSGTLRLLNASGAVLLEVGYASTAPWPVAGAGTGHSLVLARASLGERNPAAWASSDRIGGSPGALESILAEPLRGVKINEFLANPDGPDLDFIELYNPHPKPVDLSGCFLSDEAAQSKFRIPLGTVLPARGFATFTQTQLGFAIDSDGEQLFLVNSNHTRVIDAISFAGQASGISAGRWPDGAPTIQALLAPTPGSTNTPVLPADLVINEIMYNPISGNTDDEYVELFNQGTNTIDLSGWSFTDGIRFIFPTNAFISAGGYLVIARNVDHLLATYPQLNSVNTLGNYDGTLSNGGERLALSRPEPPLPPGGLPSPTTAYVLVDEVTYGTGGRWGQWADGGGSSLELIDPRSDHRQPSSWADSDESAKATAWTLIEHTGVLDNGSADHAATAVQLFLLGAGECLVDNIEVVSGGTNRVANGTFETGIGGWLLEGNHDASGLEVQAGFESSRSLHVRASGHGGPVADRVRARLTSTPAIRSVATLRARVRWLRGHPEFLMRLRGNWLEAAGTLAVPSQLGTPGAANSRALQNVGPSISEVSHHPILPSAGQSVTITARIADPDGLGEVSVRYRLDPSSEILSLPMRDDGAQGDLTSRDGVYTAVIAGPSAGGLIAFHIQASDRFTPAANRTFPANDPIRECLIRFGESQPFGNLGTYRLWMTRATQQRWSTRGNNSNQPLDCTFVYGNQRVIYNMGASYSGSPFKTPGYDSPIGAGCDYNLDFPEDDQFLGATGFEIATPGNFPGEAEPTALREQLSYWIARQLGLPFMERRFVHFFVNGVKRSLIMEDTQIPNGDVVEEWFPEDSEGELFKTSFSFEIDEATPAPLTWMPASLQVFNTTGGVKKTARYRWNWQPRAVRGGSANDYASIFRLVDAANATAPSYTAALEGLIDAEQWMRFFAYEHIVGQWDSLGYNTGSNVYPYKGRNGRWNLLPWDVDISFVADGPTSDLFVAADPPLARMNSHPPFRRAYWRALKDAVNGPLLETRVGPVAAARHAALRANGLNVTPPDDATSYIRQRRTYILSQLAAAEAPFALGTSNPPTTSSNLATLTGTAPLAAAGILANGVAYRVTWTSAKAWSMSVPLKPGTNQIDLQWVDRFGSIGTNAPIRVNVISTGLDTSPVDVVVFNEVMYAPLVHNTEFVELLNSSGSSAFDLSGWGVEPLGMVFPTGTLIAPRQTLLLVKDRAAFATAYGPEPVVFAPFEGQLPNPAGILRLVKPATQGTPEVIVDEFRYESTNPWPEAAHARGSSLQLIDATRDNRRVANWSDGSGWRFFSVSGVPGSDATRLSLWSDSAGEIYLDQVSLVRGSIPEQGLNLVQNPGFDDLALQPWQATGNHSNSVSTPTVHYLGSGALRLIAAGSGSVSAAISQELGGIDPAGAYTLSFWYLPSASTNNLNYRLSSGFRSVKAINIRPALSTPGALNSAAAPLPDFPPIWLNEVQPDNRTGLKDRTGNEEPWVELWNSGTQTVSLEGFFLSNQYSNASRWAFPPGSTLTPGEFRVVFLDGESNQTTDTEWHSSFRPNATSGSIVLSRQLAPALQVVDYLNYDQVPTDWGYGDFPDGQPLSRQILSQVTPGASNGSSGAEPHPFINEWMADNTRTIGNEAHGNAFDDWFELYNPGSSTLDLEGYYLTDDLDDPRRFQIPAGYQIGPRDFLLVWADGLPGLNLPGRPELHVNFQLSRTGEAIGLFAPNGRRLDAVLFRTQASDVSEGRIEDGSSQIGVLKTPSPAQPNSRIPIVPPHLTLSISGRPQVSFLALSNQVYALEWRESLDYGRWLPLRNVITVPSDQVVWVEDLLPSTEERYYRLITPPAASAPAGPWILRSPRSTMKNAGERIELSVLAVGTGELTYEWRFNGQPLAGASSSKLVIPNASPLSSGAYQVVVTDQTGATSNHPPAQITVRP